MDELYVDWLFKVNIGSSLDNNLHHHRIPQRVHDMLLVYKHQKRKRIQIRPHQLLYCLVRCQILLVSLVLRVESVAWNVLLQCFLWETAKKTEIQKFFDLAEIHAEEFRFIHLYDRRQQDKFLTLCKTHFLLNIAFYIIL